MAVGETLLKITDFPFAYSFTALIVGMLGLDIQNTNLIIFLASAGSLGTFLSVTNPLGRLLKWILKKHFQRKKSNDSNLTAKNKHTVRAIYSRSIGTEIDKAVSLGYFIIILYLFSSFINTNPSFAEQFQLIQKDGSILCDTDCISNAGNWIGYSGALIVFLVGLWNWRELQQQIIIAGIYQWGIGSEFVTPNTIDNMSKAIQQNDWKTTEEWAKLIENEIKTEKGKQDFNIDAVREVYRPLFEESMQIKATLQANIDSKTFSQLPERTWPQIKRSTANLMVKDTNFGNRMDELYGIIRRYNRLISLIENEIKNVIKNTATEFYGKPVEEVAYWFKRNGGGSSPALWTCLRDGKHPTELEPDNAVATYVELRLPEQKSERLEKKEDLERFEKLWKILVEEVEKKTGLLEIKKLPFEIKKMNDGLMPIIEGYIRKQWF